MTPSDPKAFSMLGILKTSTDGPAARPRHPEHGTKSKNKGLDQRPKGDRIITGLTHLSFLQTPKAVGVNARSTQVFHSKRNW